MIFPFLLDTCAAIWLVDDTLRPAAAEALAESYRADRTTFVSPFTAWEVGLLAASGRFRSTYPTEGWLKRVTSLPGIALADLPARVLLDSWKLPGKLNRDPADRIIAATAREFGYTVMTRDRAMLSYAKQGHLSAFEC
ncbi:MAG TPA: type II toxin-antitoxin system VapC family toxin [Rhizomicrobium sp.]|jgi:PIN domain nuclease of toxin-antitoxin system|nr:type II toxin-antitoxin system VapC family toxin [Rhizomicrobium sp.]